MNFGKQMKEGLFTNNPVFVQFLGMCSALAITTSVTNAVGMGLSVTAVLICSNVIISLLRKFIMPQVRIAAFIVVISGFVTVVELVMKAYLPDLNKSLGLFIPLIVVNCIILARAESFASKNGVVASAVDGLWQGLGYTLAVVLTSVVRELIGTGKLFAASDGSGGITILGDWYKPANIFILPPGAFLTLAFLVAAFQAVVKGAEKRAAKKQLAAAKSAIIPDSEVFKKNAELPEEKSMAEWIAENKPTEKPDEKADEGEAKEKAPDSGKKKKNNKKQKKEAPASDPSESADEAPEKKDAAPVVEPEKDDAPPADEAPASAEKPDSGSISITADEDEEEHDILTDMINAAVSSAMNGDEEKTETADGKEEANG